MALVSYQAGNQFAISYLNRTGNSLLKKMLEAIPEAISHRRAFEEFHENLRSDHPEEVRKWEAEYDTWMKQPTGSPCIFDTSDPGE